MFARTPRVVPCLSFHLSKSIKLSHIGRGAAAVARKRSAWCRPIACLDSRVEPDLTSIVGDRWHIKLFVVPWRHAVDVTLKISPESSDFSFQVPKRLASDLGLGFSAHVASLDVKIVLMIHFG
jgi:hypothetical protein